MAAFEERPKIEMEVTLRLTEIEARFLYGLAGYEHKSIHAAIVAQLGKAYTEEFIGGLYSLLKTAQALGPILDRTDKAREVFTGSMIATYPKTRSAA